MADATGTVTTNYGFKTIDGTDTAGYTSINSVITSIDTNLNDITVKDNSMILVDVPSASTPSTYMSGYSIKSNLVDGVPTALTSIQYQALGLQAPSGAYHWYKKN